MCFKELCNKQLESINRVLGIKNTGGTSYAFPKLESEIISKTATNPVTS